MSACHAGLLVDHRTPAGSAEIIYEKFLEYLFYDLDPFLSTHAPH
jgi:hypothetical protein